MPRHFTNADLGELKEHLDAEAARLRLDMIRTVHAASLPHPGPQQRNAAPDKQKTPESSHSEVFTNRTTPAKGVHGGRSSKCA